jgi:hypothetical protein
LFVITTITIPFPFLKTAKLHKQREKKKKSVSKMVPKFNGGVDYGGTGRGTKPI